MSGFYRMEVKVISKTGKRQNGAVGENSAQSASAYITASKVEVQSLSPVDASAYISGQKVETSEKSADYTKKKGVLSSAIVLPVNAPERLRDPSVLWSEVDGMAKRSNADLYREWICCFEKHLSLEQMESVARQFAESLAAEGMVVQYALHDEKSNGNYHVHFMSPCRGLDADGNWQKRKVQPRSYQLDSDGNRIPVIDKETGLQKKDKNGRKQWKKEPPVFVDSFNNPHIGNVQRWRQLFADLENQYLPTEYQVSSLSYHKQGIKKIPGRHISKAAYEVHRKLVAQLRRMPQERREAYVQQIMLQIEKECRTEVYNGTQGDVVHNIRHSEESKELQELKLSLQEDLQRVGRYKPPKQYVSKYTHGRTAITIESAFVSIVSYYQRLQNDYNTTQAAQEQTADMLMDTTAKLVQAQDDLLIMMSSGMTGIMENHLRQGEYDLTREVVETLSRELLQQKQEGQDAEIRAKLDKYRDRIRSIQSGNEETVGTAGSGDSNSTAGKREVEKTAERINKLATELQESAIRLGTAEQQSAETAKRLSEQRQRETAERNHAIKKGIGKGRSR
jgi:hypothetical protein